jgi:hypothetical protein
MPQFPEGRVGQYAATAVAAVTAAALAEGVAHTALDELTTTAAEHNAQVTRCAEELGAQATRTIRFPEACDPLKGDIPFHRRWRRERVDTHVPNSLPAYDMWQQRVYHLPSAATFRADEYRDVAADRTGDRVDGASILAGALAGAAVALGGAMRIRRRSGRPEQD